MNAPGRLLAALAVVASARSTTPLDAFKQRIGSLNHEGDGPFCLGAVDNVALEASFKTAALHEPFATLERPTVVASAPGCGAEWLAAHLRRAESRAHVELSEYPFHEHAAVPRRLDNETNVIYVLRNPFSAYHAYREALDAANGGAHGARVTPDERVESIDAYIERWHRAAVYWTTEHQTRLVHYEQLLVDPLRALHGIATLAGRLEIGEHETPAQHFGDEPPRLTNDGRCGRALVGYKSVERVRALGTAADLPRFGYSLFEARRPLLVRSDAKAYVRQ